LGLVLLLSVFVYLGWAGDAQWIEIDRSGARYERALTSWERSWEKKARISRPQQPGLCYESQGRGKAAEALWKKAVQNGEKDLAPDSRDLASDFESLGQFYSLHGQAAQAEPLLNRALDIRMKALARRCWRPDRRCTPT